MLWCSDIAVIAKIREHWLVSLWSAANNLEVAAWFFLHKDGPTWHLSGHVGNQMAPSTSVQRCLNLQWDLIPSVWTSLTIWKATLTNGNRRAIRSLILLSATAHVVLDNDAGIHIMVHLTFFPVLVYYMFEMGHASKIHSPSTKTSISMVKLSVKFSEDSKQTNLKPTFYQWKNINFHAKQAKQQV